MKHTIILTLFLASLFSAAIFAADADPLTSPEYCGSCHQRIFNEWKSSRMAKDINNQKVYQFYTGEHGNKLAYSGDKKGLLHPLAGMGNPKTGKRDENDWAGMPGKMYAKAYKSNPMPKTGKVLVGVGGFLAEGVAFDTTLKVKAPDHAKFKFTLPGNKAGKIKVHARLIYRDAFKPVSDKKGWKLEQRPMTDVTKIISDY